MIENLWLFVVAGIPLILAVVLAVYEVVRRDDLPVPRKVVWTAFLLLVPPIALALYVVVRPPRHRAAIAESAEGARRAEELVDLIEQHSLGQIDESTYSARLGELRADAVP